jgi:hypothetical protein
MGGAFIRIGVIIAMTGCGGPIAFKSDDPITVLAPPHPLPGVVVKDGAIVVLADIEFGPSSEIAPASTSVLDAVVSLSRNNPTIKTIVIERSELSPPCREALLAYLVERGLPTDIEVVP